MSQLATTGTKQISQFLNQNNVLEKFANILGDKAQGFIASVITIVNSNTDLSQATQESVYSAALMAATLDLPLNQNLGFAYIVPYKNTKQNRQEAQFQMGWRGYVQLAQRTGQYKNIAATPIFEGQLISENPLTGYEFDFTKKGENVIGYAAYFRLLNGFEKTLYMTCSEIESHAKKYSQSYKSSNKWVVDNSRWKLDFDAMASKTVIKLLISKFGPMSIEMQKAVISDQAVIRNVDTMQIEYVDNTPTTPAEIDEAKAIENCEKFINEAVSIDQLEQCKADATTFGLLIEWDEKYTEIQNSLK